MGDRKYKVLHKQEYSHGDYSIVPIRETDKFLIMQWRNEQMYHLRQNAKLDKAGQEQYFETVVAMLFEQDQPAQLLFSFLESGRCIGYGGLVHINWTDKHAEVSFLMNTALEAVFFEQHWSTFLSLIERVAFEGIGLHKLFTYAFDLRPSLYVALEQSGFMFESRLKEHCLFNHAFIDVLIHAKFGFTIRKAGEHDLDISFKFASDPEVRRYAFSRNKIDFESHREWFLNRLNDAQCIYLVFEKNKLPVGSIRLDIDDNRKARISYLIDPSFHGRGYGQLLIRHCEQYVVNHGLAIDKMTGEVMEENIPSVRTFEKLGFTRQSATDRIIFEKNIQHVP